MTQQDLRWLAAVRKEQDAIAIRGMQLGHLVSEFARRCDHKMPDGESAFGEVDPAIGCAFCNLCHTASAG